MTNSEQAEVDKFDALAARWWDLNGPLKTLHDINPLRLEFIRNNCQLFNQETLDIGCGGGILSESLALAGAHVTALDKAPELIKVAKLHQFEKNLNINYIAADIETLCSEQANTYQVITCMELLEHVPCPKQLIEHIDILAKPGADIFLSTLNRNIKSYLYAIVGAEYLLKLLPAGTHEYMKFIKPSELCSWARPHGFHAESMSGIQFNPLSKHYSLSDDVSVNYMIHMKKASHL